jgi:hypothetical protein
VQLQLILLILCLISPKFRYENKKEKKKHWVARTGICCFEELDLEPENVFFGGRTGTKPEPEVFGKTQEPPNPGLALVWLLLPSGI